MTSDVDDAFTWSDLLIETSRRLKSDQEARLLLEEVSGFRGAEWLNHAPQPAPSVAAEAIGDLIMRRLQGEPLQYVLGNWGFRYLLLHVDPRVLIPRPETEQVVEAALSILKYETRPLVADLGTGSGAIALSIANEHPSALIYGTDASRDALDVAQQNLEQLDHQKQARVRLAMGDWFGALPVEMKGKFDMIISNPPYIGTGEAEVVEEQVAGWEPHSALFSGPEGLDDIEKLVMEAPAWLKPRGTLIVELAPQQAEAVAERARSLGYQPVAIGKDLSGRQRFLVAATPGAAGSPEG